MPSIHFQARLDPHSEAMRIYREYQSRGFDNRAILDMALLALGGWDAGEVTEIRVSGGALRRMLHKIIEQLNLVTVEDLERALAETLANLPAQGGVSPRVESSLTGQVSDVLRGFLSSYNPDHEQEWPTEE